MIMRNLPRSHFEGDAGATVAVAVAGAAEVASFGAAWALPADSNTASSAAAMARPRSPAPKEELSRASCANACSVGCLLRRRDPGRADKARGIAESLDHNRVEVLGLAGDAGAGTHRVAVLLFQMRRRSAQGQRTRRLHYQFAEMHDAEIGGAEMLARAVGDRALAVLHGGILFGDALDAGVAPGLLQLAVDQI